MKMKDLALPRTVNLNKKFEIVYLCNKSIRPSSVLSKPEEGVVRVLSRPRDSTLFYVLTSLTRFSKQILHLVDDA